MQGTIGTPARARCILQRAQGSGKQTRLHNFNTVLIQFSVFVNAIFKNCRSASSFLTVGFFSLVHYVELAFEQILTLTYLQFVIFCSDIFRAVTNIIMWQNMVGAGEQYF